MIVKGISLCFILLVCSALGEQKFRTTRINGFECAADKLIIKIDKNAFDKKQSSFSSLSCAGLAVDLGLPAGVVIENNAFSRLMKRRSGLHKNIDHLDAGSHQILKLNGKLSIEQALVLLKDHPLLEYAEPDYIGYVGATIPTDPDYSDQWHHTKIDSPHAWDFTQGTSTVIVAVLDTGLSTHTNLFEFTNRTVTGYDFAYDDSNPEDDHGHGTAVAGVISANANNGKNIAGVDWNCMVMPVKVLKTNDTGGSWGYYSWWADGVNYAVSNGADVINLSAGGSGTSSSLISAITNAVAQGVIFVTITHNDGTSTITFPGTLPETITVGATDSDDTKSSFSNWGSEIDLVAPGRDIYTVNRWGFTTYWSGTSFSAPQVAGVATLLLSLRPELDNEDVRTLLCAGAEDQVGDANDTPGFDNYYGWGRLNSYNTLLLANSEMEIGLTSNETVLSWNSPANASNKQPYTIESKSDLLSGNWFSLPESNITYSASQTTYTVNGGTNMKSFYRYKVSVE